jgi:hypothetical protein
MLIILAESRSLRIKSVRHPANAGWCYDLAFRAIDPRTGAPDLTPFSDAGDALGGLLN